MRHDPDRLTKDGDTDAMKWAEAFSERFSLAYRTNCDPAAQPVADPEGLMVGWFANAIEAGRAAGKRSLTDEYERGKRDAAAALT